MSVIPLHSPDGQRLRMESSEKALYYQPIINKIFQKQVNSTYCGIVSSLLAMNANFIGKNGSIDDGGPQVPFSEANMFSFKETQNVLKESEVKIEGCTLQKLTDLIKAHDYSADTYYAGDSSEEEFRTKAKSALSNSNSKTSVIINYDLKLIYPDQSVKGHFSPLGAYHEESDCFLVLDTWPATEECWVKSELLFSSLNTIDDMVSKTRGFVIVSKE